MNSNKTKRLFKKIIIVFIIILVIPITTFIINFKKHSVSNLISDWGAFGDYFGGILNTIISFLSLIILGLLTYYISKQSNDENKKVNLLMRKLDSYDELTKHLPEVNQFLPNLDKSCRLLTNKFSNELIDPLEIKEEKKELFYSISTFSDFYYFLYSFNARYGHLFNYDFDSENFKLLLKKGSELNDHFKSVKDSFEFGENKYSAFEVNVLKDFFDLLVKFINGIREELE